LTARSRSGRLTDDSVLMMVNALSVDRRRPMGGFMTGIQVSRADIESVTQIVAGLDVPPASKALLSAIVTAINEAIGSDGEPVTVSVERAPSIREQFDTAFAADEAGTAEGVTVTISKVGR
jgi:hypothetical protein